MDEQPPRYNAGSSVRHAVAMAPEIQSAKDAADNESVLAMGRLLSAANGLEYLLGRALEAECGISHVVFEVLLILGRRGPDGLSMRAIAQQQVLTTGGATRLVDRMITSGLVERVPDPGDGRGRLVKLTARGEAVTVKAARVHVANVEALFLGALPPNDRSAFVAALRPLSLAVRAALPRLP